ncbi:unnamed protein product [uncultured bacterium]|nr:unnamed protein product [uncultured bacterium]
MALDPVDAAREEAEHPDETLRVEQDLPVYQRDTVHFRVPDADGRVMLLTLDFVCCTDAVLDELGYRDDPSWEVRPALASGWWRGFRLLS